MQTTSVAVTSDNVTNNVVLNDKTNAAPEAKVTPVSILFDLEEKRIKWQDGTYRKCNDELYQLLASCLQYAGDLDPLAAKERSKALQHLYKQRGYQWRKETPLITKVVRAVFGDTDRRRTSTYSLVLRQAKNERIAFAGLAQWIENKGGLQQIKLSHSNTYVSPKTKVEIAQKHFENLETLAEVKTEALSLLADTEYIGEDCLLIAQQQTDGSFTVRALVRNGSAINAAFATLYSKQKAEQEAESKNTQAAKEADGAMGITA